MATVKRARMRVSVILFEDLFRGRMRPYYNSTTNAPADLRILGVQQPPEGIEHWFYLIVESDSFAAIPEGAKIPEIDPFIFRRREDVEGGQLDDKP